jgi:hypothetical protein
MALVDRYEKEVRSIKKNILQMCWHMRGGITYNEAMDMGQAERDIIAGIIKENLETTKKTGLNYF